MPAFKYSLKELIENPSFRRWVRGEASEKEKIFWDQWIMKDSENRSLAMRAQEEIEGFILKSAEESSTEEAWQSIWNNLSKDRKDWQNNISSRKSLGSGGLVWTYRVAAAILLLIVCSVLITRFYEDPSGTSVEFADGEVTTDYGERKSILLSDGTKIVLNSNSSMVYTINPTDPTAVDLFLEGEAHFSVAKRKHPGDTPFRVRTDEGMVEVLGTQLVVSTRNSSTRVVLTEGSVSVNPFHLNAGTILKPGQMGEFNNRSDSVMTRFVDLRIYTSWMKGRLFFDKTPMSEVAERLENTFGVKIMLRDPSMHDKEVSGAIESEELGVVTSALSEILNTCIEEADSGETVYVGCTQ